MRHSKSEKKNAYGYFCTLLAVTLSIHLKPPTLPTQQQDTQTERDTNVILHLYVVILCLLLVSLHLSGLWHHFIVVVQLSLFTGAGGLRAHFTCLWVHAQLLSVCDAFLMIEEVPCCEGQGSKLALLWLSERLHLKGYKCTRMLWIATCYYPIEHIPFRLNNRCQQTTGVSTHVTKLTEQ